MCSEAIKRPKAALWCHQSVLVNQRIEPFCLIFNEAQIARFDGKRSHVWKLNLSARRVAGFSWIIQTWRERNKGDARLSDSPKARKKKKSSDSLIRLWFFQISISNSLTVDCRSLPTGRIPKHSTWPSTHGQRSPRERRTEICVGCACESCEKLFFVSCRLSGNVKQIIHGAKKAGEWFGTEKSNLRSRRWRCGLL